jgi:MOSC domain-containing protein YiiM
MSAVLSVNLASGTTAVPSVALPTGIGKIATDSPVEIREPGPKADGLGSGLVGDVIGDPRHHGGTDQAVYAYARECLDIWQSRLGTRLPSGRFGENLTTIGVDVDGARLGERWQIGESLILQVTCPRVPCATFRAWIGERGWLKQFTQAELPGAYLRVVAGGVVQAGDPIEVVHRPSHAVTITLAFRALVRDAALLPSLLAAGDDLTDELRDVIGTGKTYVLDR